MTPLTQHAKGTQVSTTESDRDYAAEMRAVIDGELQAPEIAVPLVARDVVEKLRANDPELLAGWLDAQADVILTEHIGSRLRSVRQRTRIQGRRSAFGEHVERFEAGSDPASVSSWLTTHFHGPTGDMHLGRFDHDALVFAKDAYAERAAVNAFESHFFAALAKKVNGGTVADHFTDEQIAAMRSSLGDA